MIKISKKISIFLMMVMLVIGFSLSAGAEPTSAPLVLAANVGPSFATSTPEILVVEMPMVTKDTVMHVSGTFTLTANIPTSELVIAGRLRIMDGTSQTASFFDITFDVIPDKLMPNRIAFRKDIDVSELMEQEGFNIGSATLVLDARLNIDPKVSPAPAPPISLGRFTAGVYIEEVSAAPRFAPYAAWLAEPRPDPNLPWPPLQ